METLRPMARVVKAAIRFWETVDERDLTDLTPNQGFAWQELCDAIRAFRPYLFVNRDFV